jgi:D-serine deaminase-like pyridoxal phosphate-dependent protein
MAASVYDVYISNEVVAPSKLARVAALAHRVAAEHGQLAIAVDSIEGVTRLAVAMNEARALRGGNTVIDVFVEIDVGQGRCGVAPGQPAVALAQEIRKHPALRFAGLQAYHGKAQHMRSAQERREAIAVVADDVRFTRKLIEAEGIPWTWSPGPARAPWCARRRAACSANCRPGRSSSWTPTMRATSATRPSRISSMPCS